MNEDIDTKKRLLIQAASCVGLGLGIASLCPFIASVGLSEATKERGTPVEVDLATVPPGHMRTVMWQGQPIWILHRTAEMLASVHGQEDRLRDPCSTRNSAVETPASCRNPYRAIQARFLVVVGLCTHFGCIPLERFQQGAQAHLPDDWRGGFLCPCHGSLYDLSGRVFKNMPASDNLAIPAHHYRSSLQLLVGSE